MAGPSARGRSRATALATPTTLPPERASRRHERSGRVLLARMLATEWRPRDVDHGQRSRLEDPWHSEVRPEGGVRDHVPSGRRYSQAVSSETGTPLIAILETGWRRRA